MNPNPQHQQAMVDAWNARNAVGTKVNVINGQNTPIESVTTSQAVVICGFSVINLKGFDTPVDLRRVTSRP